MAFEGFRYLARRTVSDKVLRDNPFKIANNPQRDRYRWGVVSMVY